MMLTIVRGIGPVLIVHPPCIVMEQAGTLAPCEWVLLSWGGVVWVMHRRLVHPADVETCHHSAEGCSGSCPSAACDLHLCKENSQSHVATLSLKPRTESMDGWP